MIRKDPALKKALDNLKSVVKYIKKSREVDYEDIYEIGKVSRRIFRRIVYLHEREKPIRDRTYERIIELHVDALQVTCDTEIGEAICKRLEYLEEWYWQETN